jgi:hypothetical protein
LLRWNKGKIVTAKEVRIIEYALIVLVALVAGALGGVSAQSTAPRG